MFVLAGRINDTSISSGTAPGVSTGTFSVDISLVHIHSHNSTNLMGRAQLNAVLSLYQQHANSVSFWCVRACAVNYLLDLFTFSDECPIVSSGLMTNSTAITVVYGTRCELRDCVLCEIRANSLASNSQSLQINFVRCVIDLNAIVEFPGTAGINLEDCVTATNACQPRTTQPGIPEATRGFTPSLQSACNTRKVLMRVAWFTLVLRLG
jgi:hypothetical protein